MQVFSAKRHRRNLSLPYKCLVNLEPISIPPEEKRATEKAQVRVSREIRPLFNTAYSSPREGKHSNRYGGLVADDFYGAAAEQDERISIMSSNVGKDTDAKPKDNF